MAVPAYVPKPERLTFDPASGTSRAPTDGEPAKDFNDLDTQMQLVSTDHNALETTVGGKANASHQHSGADITSGTVAPARLGSGTPSASTYLRGDGAWAAVSGGGTGTVSDATTTSKGVVQLAGDLAGTAAAPTVPGLAGKAETSHTHAAADTTSGTFAVARLPAATTGAQGIVQLAGDLAGTAAAPTVPGLAGKANTAHTHAAADVTSGTFSTARLGSGTASSSTYLRGDGTWATVAAGSSLLTVRTVTGATTLTSSDQYVRVNSATAVTVTVPTGLATGTVTEVRQIGVGQVTLAGAGVTFTGNLKTAGQNQSVRIVVTGSNAVDVDGGVL